MELTHLLILVGIPVCVAISSYCALWLLNFYRGRKLIKNRYFLLRGMNRTEARTKYEIIRYIDNEFFGGEFTAAQMNYCSVVFNNDVGPLRNEKLVEAQLRQKEDGTSEITYTLTHLGLKKMLEVASSRGSEPDDGSPA